MTGTLPDFPEGIGEIVTEVRKRIRAGEKFGHAKIAEEDGALEIIKRIKSRGLPAGHDPSVWESPMKRENENVIERAAKLHFKFLLTSTSEDS